MKILPISMQLPFLIVAGFFILACNKPRDQNALKLVLTSIPDPNVKAPRTANKSMNLSNIIYNTDYQSAGAGGMRGVGSGHIKIAGTFALSSVTKAFLYWYGRAESLDEAGNSVRFNTNMVSGTPIGMSSTNFNKGISNNSQAYRADVTTIVNSSASRVFEISDFGELDPTGASLILFYSDGNDANNRDIVLFEGNDSNYGFAGYPGNPNAPYDPPGWNVLLQGINYTSGNVELILHVADGQPEREAALSLNDHRISGGLTFNGSTVPGGLWDVKSWSISHLLNPKKKSLHLTSCGYDDDFLSLVVAVFNLPKGAAPTIKNWFTANK